ncbi:signal peptidase I [Paenibacillus sp. IB182496]|uniref:Signal peptidase I n=1 Tax=Paenibacillus sabuli TaxID=2772509 RepID=A0A927BZB6_9BACL|nr:signal peptidase I [Paenibacillus sabuli]MBD2848365.1 signal peptidase I [Paenibacillus sabuli]
MSRTTTRQTDGPDGGSLGPRSRWVAELLDWGKTLAIAFVVVLLLHFFVFNLSTVEGSSMEPTLEEREWLFVNKIVYFVGHPKRGDIVITKDPEHGIGRKEYLVKRVIGVPGDTIAVRDGRLYRNGEPVDEPYTNTWIEDPDFAPVEVEPGTYFVMGDNRRSRASRDSRAFGTVPEDLIRGRADVILWPLDKLNLL